MNSNDNHSDASGPPPAGPLHAYIEPEMEARLTALVLGEASDFEREELERQIGETPELGIYRRRLETLHSLLRGLSAEGNEAMPEGESSATEWKLSGGRREALLAVMGGADEAESGSESEMATAGMAEKEKHGIALVLAETNAKPHSRTKISWFRVAWGVAACVAVLGMAFLYLSVGFLSDSGTKIEPPMMTATVASEQHESLALSRAVKSAETAKSAMPMAVTDPAPEAFRFQQAVPGKPMVADGDGRQGWGDDLAITEQESTRYRAQIGRGGFASSGFEQQQVLAGRQLAEMGKKLSEIVPPPGEKPLNQASAMGRFGAETLTTKPGAESAPSAPFFANGSSSGRAASVPPQADQPKQLGLIQPEHADGSTFGREDAKIADAKGAATAHGGTMPANPAEPEMPVSGPAGKGTTGAPDGTVALAAGGEILSHQTGDAKLAITNIEGRNGRGESAQNPVPAARPGVPMPAQAPISSPTPIDGKPASGMGGGGAEPSGDAPLDDFKRRSTVEASSEPQPARRESTAENAGEKAVAADVTIPAADPFAAPNSNLYFDESRAKTTTEMGRSAAGLGTRPSSGEQAMAGPMQAREKAKDDFVAESLETEVDRTISSSPTKFKAHGNTDELRTSAATRSAGDAVTNGRGNLAAAPAASAPAAKDLSPEPPAAPAAEGLSDRDSDKVESFGTMVAGERRDSLQALAQREEKVQELQELKKEVAPEMRLGEAEKDLKALMEVLNNEAHPDHAEAKLMVQKAMPGPPSLFPTPPAQMEKKMQDQEPPLKGHKSETAQAPDDQSKGGDTAGGIGWASQAGAIRTWERDGKNSGVKLYDGETAKLNPSTNSGGAAWGTPLASGMIDRETISRTQPTQHEWQRNLGSNEGSAPVGIATEAGAVQILKAKERAKLFQEDINFLNKTPYRKVDVPYEPGIERNSSGEDDGLKRIDRRDRSVLEPPAPSALKQILDLVPRQEDASNDLTFSNPRLTKSADRGTHKGHGQVTPIQFSFYTSGNNALTADTIDGLIKPNLNNPDPAPKDIAENVSKPDEAITHSLFNRTDPNEIIVDSNTTLYESPNAFAFITDGVVTNPAARPLREVPAGLDEISASAEPFSTFSLHVSDVSFQLAQTALAKGEWPEAARIRIEEFVNAFNYSDPMPSSGDRVACRIEQAAHPFLQQRNLMRIAMRTAEAGRASGTPLRLTLLLDNSGSMERADRQDTVRRAFATLASLLKEGDQVTLIAFARQPRLLADGVGGDQAGKLVDTVAQLPSEGGTNLEAALSLAHEKARQHHHRDAQNRVVLLTDGAANLGDAKPESLSRTIEEMRLGGIAFDAAGIGADGLNDDILEALTRKGDGRYYLLNRPEDAEDGFAKQIAGALRPAAKNVKVQVEFNPNRVSRHKLLGFEKHLLEKEDFRNDAVDAAEMAAAEAGVAVYQVESKPDGEGDIGAVSVRFQDTASGQMIEKRWPIPYAPDAPHPHDAAASLRLATVAAQFAAKLKGGPLADVVDLEELARLLGTLPESDQQQERVRQLRDMIEQARQLEGK